MKLLSFRVTMPVGVKGVLPLVTREDAWYEGTYRYERRGTEWWAVLESVREIMPPATPQMMSGDDAGRLHMMREDGSLDFEAEAEQRRKEWAQINERVWLDMTRDLL